MPTVFKTQGFRFFFYSNENDEPMHIHIEKADAEGKVWLEPEICIAYMYNFSRHDQRQIMDIVIAKEEMFKEKWHEYFA